MGNKGLEERLLLLERKAASDQQQKEKEIQSELAERKALEEKIHSLQPRIETLITLADKCVNLRIKFPSKNTTYKYGFDSSHPRGFIADGVSHYLGFYNLGHKDTYLAILNGGYNGPVDFLTNGTIITGRLNRPYDNGDLCSARNEDMKKFISKFEEFESAFLKWIDSLSVPEDQNSTDKNSTDKVKTIMPKFTKFKLKPEHIKLMESLNFRVSVFTDSAESDKYRPVIDFKRPFGNSAHTLAVCMMMGLSYGDEDIEKAETLIIELPVALEIVMRNHTFDPGEYEVDKYSPAYVNYVHIRNYHALKAPLAEMEEKYKDCDQMKSLHNICMNVSGDDPWKVIDDLKWFTSTDFLADAITVFEKHRENNSRTHE